MIGRFSSAVVALLIAGCTATPRSAAEVENARPTTRPSGAAVSLPTVDYGGAHVRWPARRRTKPAPRALGAAVTTAAAPLANGRALEPGLTLPIVGGSSGAPVVLTPCMTKVRLKGSGFTRIAPATETAKIVVVDPGHGGRASPGAVGPDGSRESVRNLQVGTLVARYLRGSVAHVVLTRATDRVAQIDFRIALADALRASFAVSIHFNTSADGPSKTPGTTIFGSVADPNGRRAAGVMFEAQREYLDTLTPLLRGHWVSYRGAGAVYRLGDRGDFYRVLRESHVTWVLSESLFISNPAEARLLGRADVRAGLARSIATGVRRFLETDAEGSGWRAPIDFGDGRAGGDLPCTEPYV